MCGTQSILGMQVDWCRDHVYLGAWSMVCSAVLVRVARGHLVPFVCLSPYRRPDLPKAEGLGDKWVRIVTCFVSAHFYRRAEFFCSHRL